MNTSLSETAIIRIHCPDQKGIVARVTDFIHRNNGNVVALDQHTDRDDKRFFMRIEWELDGFALTREQIEPAFEFAIATPCKMTWRLDFSDEIPRMALFVSKMSHCLYDLLARYQGGEFKVNIPLVISNHTDLEEVVKKFGIDFVHIPVTAATKAEQEKKELEILKERQIDFIVLARYMQVLSLDFVKQYPERIINIHHSFLPAFAGAKPYHAAHARGVKLIGAPATMSHPIWMPARLSIRTCRASATTTALTGWYKKGVTSKKLCFRVPLKHTSIAKHWFTTIERSFSIKKT